MTDEPTQWEGHACGLRISSDVALFPSSVGGRPAERRLHVAAADEPIAMPDHDEHGPAVVEDDGGAELVAVVEGVDGFVLDAPGIARVAVSADGTQVRYAAEPASGPAWKRLIADQALPIAATLQGLETLHAASVIVHGRTLALAGPSGVGKSSLLRRLMDAGGTFVADDVIAMERVEDHVIVHPGPSWVSLRPAELAALERAGLARGRAHITGKSTDHVEGRSGGTRLSALLLLERSPELDTVTVEPTPPDPGELLALSFNFLVETPDRLFRMLDVFSCLSASARVLRVRSPLHGDAGVTAQAILAEIAE